MSAIDARVRRKSRVRKTPEDDELVRIVSRLRAAGYQPWHTPNEGMIPPQYRARLKAKGLRKGVVDIMLFHPTRVLAVLEHKREGGDDPTPEQSEFLAEAAAAGALTGVSHGEAEALAILRSWGYRV
jgi:hypothetical protein